MTQIIYLNGEYVNLEDAKISVMDRGFLLGDGVYEVIPIYNGHLFLVERHLEHLRTSLMKVAITLNLTDENIQAILNELLKKNPSDKAVQSAYIQITRGVVKKREHIIKSPITPTVMMKIDPVTVKYADDGIKAITVEDIRWRCCDIKSINRLGNVLMSQKAYEAKAQQAIIKENNLVVEGAVSNVFICKNGVIKTPKPSSHVLFGITRGFVIELAKQNQMPLQECDITYEQLIDADEVWLTSSSLLITAVTSVDGKSGPMQQKMLALYRNYVSTL